MSNILRNLSDLTLQLDANGMKGHELLEVTFGESLFFDLLTELQFDFRQGDLFKGYKEIPSYVKVYLPFGHVTVKKGMVE